MCVSFSFFKNNIAPENIAPENFWGQYFFRGLFFFGGYIFFSGYIFRGAIFFNSQQRTMILLCFLAAVSGLTAVSVSPLSQPQTVFQYRFQVKKIICGFFFNCLNVSVASCALCIFRMLLRLKANCRSTPSTASLSSLRVSLPGTSGGSAAQTFFSFFFFLCALKRDLTFLFACS